ncbi:MAG: hypothetical protein LUC43_02685 [Burkholderiales bacterium]|nr:hypothetical protein [Burkholderiales bacterium]
MVNGKIEEDDKFDPAEFLYSEHEIKDFLNEALEIKCGPKSLARCIDAAIRVKGMLDISAKMGVSVENLYAQVRNCQNLTPAKAIELVKNMRDALGMESKQANE